MNAYIQPNLFDGKPDLPLRETYLRVESENVDVPSCHDCRHVVGNISSGYSCVLLSRDVSHAGWCRGHEFKSIEHKQEYEDWKREWLLGQMGIKGK